MRFRGLKILLLAVTAAAVLFLEVAELYELLAYGRGSLNVAAGLYIHSSPRRATRHI